jgi:hypothetical protein
MSTLLKTCNLYIDLILKGYSFINDIGVLVFSELVMAGQMKPQRLVNESISH